ncbi:MAG TPA: 16S rRNA (uracil(1498)-N(3))-methyltransferase [Capsulimonadaceae bacterium]|nr:16S rRNA (uracil(1498)-N(3))-methyltransferase [Capsulimonadaceae bacterium]
MSRYFIPTEQIDETAGTVLFEGQDAHHLHTVLRMRPGQTVYALDGEGHEYEAVLEEVGKSRARARLQAKRALNTELPIKVTVAQALPRTLEKLEWVLQHGTEIGASGFIVFESARGRSDGERLVKKSARWQEIVRSAAEQSHRAHLPTVDAILSFRAVLEIGRAHDLSVLAYEGERKTKLGQVLPKNASILAIIGPEGGFTDEEVASARAAGVVPVTLGPRILRTETAGLVLLSQIACLVDEQ